MGPDAGGYGSSGPVTVPPVIPSDVISPEDIRSAPPVFPVGNAIAEIQDTRSSDIPSDNALVPEGIPTPPVAPVAGANDSQWTVGSIPWTLEQAGFNTLNDLLILAELDEVYDKEGSKRRLDFLFLSITNVYSNLRVKISIV